MCFRVALGSLLLPVSPLPPPPLLFYIMAIKTATMGTKQDIGTLILIMPLQMGNYNTRKFQKRHISFKSFHAMKWNLDCHIAWQYMMSVLLRSTLAVHVCSISRPKPVKNKNTYLISPGCRRRAEPLIYPWWILFSSWLVDPCYLRLPRPATSPRPSAWRIWVHGLCCPGIGKCNV